MKRKTGILCHHSKRYSKPTFMLYFTKCRFLSLSLQYGSRFSAILLLFFVSLRKKILYLSFRLFSFFPTSKYTLCIQCFGFHHCYLLCLTMWITIYFPCFFSADPIQCFFLFFCFFFKFISTFGRLIKVNYPKNGKNMVCIKSLY